MSARKSRVGKRRVEAKRVMPAALAVPPQGDVMFWRPTAEDAGDRDYEDIMLRRVPRQVAHRFRGAAGARAMTHAQYLSALVALHESMRERALHDTALAAVLDKLGLRTVSI